MLRSDLCNYSDAYVLVSGTIRVAGNAPRDRQDRPVILKNNAPFISCITRINAELIEDANDLDVVMPTYNLLEYSKNYRKYNHPNNNVVSSSASKYKSKLLGNTPDVGSTHVVAGARVANPDYNSNESGTKKSNISCTIKIFR